jgi:cytochrome c oxidase assembly protein subunit 11
MTRGNRRTLVSLVMIVVGMGCMAYASVPLYRLFCQATGFGGATQRASAAPAEIADAVVTVRFDAETASDLGLEFRPLQNEVRVHPGEQLQVFFRAVNHSAETVTGSATYNVTPTKSGIYFDKLQCFCFTEQRLGPGESRDMGVVFFVDPDLLKDPGTRDVRTITLAYTMFRAHGNDAPSASASPRAPAPGNNPAVN